MRVNARWVALIAATTLATWTCGSDATGPASAPTCGAETTSVSATVTSGSSTSFDWSPNCAAMMVLVEDMNGGDVWWLSTPETEWSTPERANRILPRVSFGEVRTGLESSPQTLPLVPGTAYKLVLWRMLPAGSTARCQQNLESICLMSVTTFTR